MLDDEIGRYLDSVPEPTQSDMRRLHRAILDVNPGYKLWFFSGKDDSGKVVSNPNIGYGLFGKKYADGKVKEFYQIGISANSSGISVYIMGLSDKTYLKEKYARSIGKASLTGYCIKFKTLKDIDFNVLMEAIQDGIERTRA